MNENNEGMDSESSGIIRRICICDAAVFLLYNASKVEYFGMYALETDTIFLYN